MRNPRIIPRTPSCLLTTALVISNSSCFGQCVAGGIYISPATALYEYLSYNQHLSLIRTTRRWSSGYTRYTPPSSAERAHASADAGGSLSGRYLEGDSSSRGRGGVGFHYRRGTPNSETSRHYEPFRHRHNGRYGIGDNEANRGKYTGPRKRLPNPAPPPKMKPATVLSETNIPQLSQEELSSAFSQELFVFRCDTSAALIPSAMANYPNLRSLNILLPEDISNLARQLHSRFRHDKDAGAILPHIKLLISDLRSGAIPGHPLASVHIISCLKAMEEFTLVNEFWEWLKQQREEYCDARVYGAAIEALAFQGEPLPQLERLYAEAFDRYSNTRDISPSEARESGATRIMLLQGIITARTLNGDWRAAYEAFDLILRLYPTATPHRVYELFIFERPVSEAFTVFLMACRAGTPLTSGVLTSLLREVWMTHQDVSAMLRLCWAYAGAGGELTIYHLNSIIKGLLLSCTDEPIATVTGAMPTSDEIKAHQERFTTLLNSIRALISSFRSRNIPPNVSTFNTLISCGGELKRADIVLGSLRDMLKSGIRPNEVTFRTLVNVAADLNDGTQLEEAWNMLANARIEERDRHVKEARASGGIIGNVTDHIKWDLKDWKALISSGLRLGKDDFAKAEIEKYKAESAPQVYTFACGFFNGSKQVGKQSTKHSKAPKRAPYSFERTIVELGRFLQTFHSPAIVQFSPPPEQLYNTSAPDSLSTNPDPTSTITSSAKTASPKMRPASSLPEYLPIDLDLTAPYYPPLPSPHLQLVYASLLLTSTLSTKAQSPSYLGTLTTDSDNRSSTGYTLRELRFQNWVAINKLLFQAELHDRAVEAEVSRKITKQGLKPGPSVKNHLWKEEQIRERVRRVNDQATKELAKGEDVDVNVRTGNITWRNENGREEVMRGVKEEEWQIRRILGGGGFAWGTIEGGKEVLPEMFDKRLEIENSAEKDVQVVEEMEKSQPKEEAILSEKIVTEQMTKTKAETDSRAAVRILTKEIEQKSIKNTGSFDKTQQAILKPHKVLERPERGERDSPARAAQKPDLPQKEKGKEKEKEEILTRRPFAKIVEKKKLLNEKPTEAKDPEIGEAKKAVESAAPELPLDKPEKEKIAIKESSVKALQQSHIQTKLKQEEQLAKDDKTDISIKFEKVDRGSMKAADASQGPSKESSLVELGDKVSEQINFKKDEKLQETGAVSVGTNETPASTEVTLKKLTKTLLTPTPLTPPKPSNTPSTTIPPRPVSVPASPTAPAPEPAVPEVAPTSSTSNSQLELVSFPPQETLVPESTVTIHETSLSSPSITAAHSIISNSEVTESPAAEGVPGPPWPTVSIPSNKADLSADEILGVKGVKKVKTKDDTPTASSHSKAPNKRKQRPISKKQSDSEITEPGPVEAANAIASAQAAEISATEAGKAEKIATASASLPEPTPPTEPNTIFVSPLLHGSHISETIIPPKGPSPSPEQLQKAMEELSALSEAENELADVMAELFAITEEVSPKKTTIQGVQEKEEAAIRVDSLQEELTPLPPPPMNGKGVGDPLPTTSAPETLVPVLKTQPDSLLQLPGEETTPRPGIHEGDSYVSKQYIDKPEDRAETWQEDHQIVQSTAIETPIEFQQKTSSPSPIQANSNLNGRASQSVIVSDEESTMGERTVTEESKPTKAVKSRKRDSRSSNASK